MTKNKIWTIRFSLNMRKNNKDMIPPTDEFKTEKQAYEYGIGRYGSGSYSIEHGWFVYYS